MDYGVLIYILACLLAILIILSLFIELNKKNDEILKLKMKNIGLAFDNKRLKMQVERIQFEAMISLREKK